MLKPLQPFPSISPAEAPTLRAFLARDVDGLKQLRDLFSAVVEIREQEEQLLAGLQDRVEAALAAPAVTSRGNPGLADAIQTASPNELRPAVLPRRPMRPPRPGSVRALIYRVLSAHCGVPQRRADIVRAVAELKGATVESCEKPVATVLRDKFDRHLRRTAYGQYTYVVSSETQEQG